MSIPLLRWAVRGTAWVVAGNFYATSWQFHFQSRFFKPHRSTCLYTLRGMDYRRLSAGLALLQDDDSRDRVSPVLGAAAGIQGAETLVGCVHGLSLRCHADDWCVWVHVTGKSNGTEARQVLSGAEGTPQTRKVLRRMVSHLVLSLGFTVNKAEICWSQD